MAELEKLRVKLGLSSSALNVYLNLRPEDRDALKSMMTGNAGAASPEDADLLFTGTRLTSDSYCYNHIYCTSTSSALVSICICICDIRVFVTKALLNCDPICIRMFVYRILLHFCALDFKFHNEH